MPPTTKPQTKKKEAEEGKGEKAVAVAALLLFVVLAAFVEAQIVTNTNTATTATNTNTAAKGNATGGMPDADKALSGFKNIAKWVVLGVRTAIAMAFWVAFAIMVAHFALGKVAPTRFQRLGAFWDGLERAKDIIYGYAWLFLLIFSIYATIGIITNGGNMDVGTFTDVVKWIMVDPITDLFKELQGSQRAGP